MSQEEIYGTRDRSYSAWHRRMSTRRFVGIEKAQTLAMIDLDASLYVEYDDRTKEPIALMETARDVGQSNKPSTVTRNLARKAGLAACVVLYKTSAEKNPADPRWPDIVSFRVKRIWPPGGNWRNITPRRWAEILVELRVIEAAKLDKLLDSEGTLGKPFLTNGRNSDKTS